MTEGEHLSVCHTAAPGTGERAVSASLHGCVCYQCVSVNVAGEDRCVSVCVGTVCCVNSISHSLYLMVF